MFSVDVVNKRVHEREDLEPLCVLARRQAGNLAVLLSTDDGGDVVREVQAADEVGLVGSQVVLVVVDVVVVLPDLRRRSHLAIVALEVRCAVVMFGQELQKLICSIVQRIGEWGVRRHEACGFNIQDRKSSRDQKEQRCCG